MTQENSKMQDKSTYSRAAFWILSAALVLFVLILCGVPRPENDLFWQLRTGREIIAHHSVPYADSYSWTAKGHPWVVHEWLAFVLFWTVYSLGHAFTGLFVIKAIVAAATVFILFRHLCWATQYTLIPALFLTGLAAMSVSIGFEMRPQIFTYFFLALVCSLVLRMREENYKDKKIWLLVPIFIAWANVHSGVIVGLFLLGAWCVGDFIDGVNSPDPQEGKVRNGRAKSLLPVLIVCLLGTLLTPYGIAEYSDFAETLGNSNVINAVSEWGSPSLHDSAGMNFCFLAGVLLAGVLFSKRFVLLGDIIILIALLHSSLTSYRNIPLFALVASMIAVPYLAELVRVKKAEISASKVENTSIFGANPEIPAAIIAAFGIVFIAFASTSHSYKQAAANGQAGSSKIASITGGSISTISEPVSAVNFIQTHAFDPSWRMYNGYDEGGYLIWMLPQYPVSIDGRADVYFGKVFDDYLSLNRQSYDWKSKLAQYPSDFILVSASSGLAKDIMNSPEWALVYASDSDLDSKLPVAGAENAVIFVRRDAKNTSDIQRLRLSCPAISTAGFAAKYGDYPAVH